MCPKLRHHRRHNSLSYLRRILHDFINIQILTSKNDTIIKNYINNVGFIYILMT